MIMPLRDSIVKDFWLKLFSLALAVLIWVTVKSVLQNQPVPPSPGQPSTSLQSTNNPSRE